MRREDAAIASLITSSSSLHQQVRTRSPLGATRAIPPETVGALTLHLLCSLNGNRHRNSPSFSASPFPSICSTTTLQGHLSSFGMLTACSSCGSAAGARHVKARTVHRALVPAALLILLHSRGTQSRVESLAVKRCGEWQKSVRRSRMADVISTFIALNENQNYFRS